MLVCGCHAVTPANLASSVRENMGRSPICRGFNSPRCTMRHNVTVETPNAAAASLREYKSLSVFIFVTSGLSLQFFFCVNPAGFRVRHCAGVLMRHIGYNAVRVRWQRPRRVFGARGRSVRTGCPFAYLGRIRPSSPWRNYRNCASGDKVCGTGKRVDLVAG